MKTLIRVEELDAVEVNDGWMKLVRRRLRQFLRPAVALRARLAPSWVDEKRPLPLLWEMAAQIGAGVEPAAISGDGTPFEEAGQMRWWALDEALAACRDGRLADAKTEVALWRLAAS